MKESKHVKRISFGSLVLMVLAVIAVMAYRYAEPLFTTTTASALETLASGTYMMSLDVLENEEVVLVDVRDQHDFEKGHLDHALNIPTPTILEEVNMTRFEAWKASGTTVVLYGSTVEEANMPFLMLFQMGYDNLKLLQAEVVYAQNMLKVTPAVVETPVADIRAFIDASLQKAEAIDQARAKELAIEAAKEAAKAAAAAAPPPPKEVTPKKKKKKRPMEGGC